MSQVEKETIKSNWRVFVAIGVVILSPFQYGLDFGLIGGLQAMRGFLEVFGHRAPNTPLGWNLPPVRQQLISSLMTLGMFISSASAGFAAKYLGRRQCLWVGCAVCCIANIIMMATTNINALYVGRLLIGCANGYFMAFSQLYIQETSPPKYRGLFLSIFQFFISFGTLIGTIINWATARMPGKPAYLIPLGLIYIVPAIVCVSILFVPESPRWLISQGKFEEGKQALLRLRPTGADIDGEAEMIRAGIEAEHELAGDLGPFDMFRNPVDRRRTILAVCAVTLQPATGAMFLISYKAYFLGMANVEDPFAMSNVLSTISILAIITNSFLTVRFGRRRLCLMSGFTVCGICQLIIAIVYDKNPGTPTTGKITVALSCVYMWAYNGFVSPYAWVTLGEIPSQSLRSHTLGFASAIGYLFAWLTSFTAPYFINPSALNWGPRYGYIWFPSCVLAIAWIFWFLPEMQNRSLEEITEMFEARIPARKFRHYECHRLTAEVEHKVDNVEANRSASGKPSVEIRTERVE